MKSTPGFHARNAAEAKSLVLNFFGGDKKKTKLWFSSENPLLGNISPLQMIAVGRSEKLLNWVKQQLDLNERNGC